MFRHINGYLVAWFNRHDRKPMLLRGARQVGKTWAVRELAKASGAELIEVNFELRPECKQAFQRLEPSQILQDLSLLGFAKPQPGRSLLFLDEIQECPQAIVALRYFYEQMPELAVIGTGSLLEFTLEQERLSMPVGRIESAWLFPMSFGEFLRAKGNTGLAEAIAQHPFKHSTENALADSIEHPLVHPISPAGHAQACKELRDYLFCGGMPQAVLAMTEAKDVESVRRVHRSILQTYRQDFYKYAPRIKPHLAESLFLKAPGLVGGHFKYSHIDSDLRTSEIRPAVEALEKAGVIRRVIHSSGGLPLATHANPRICKLVMLDMGLMHAALQIDAQLVQEPDLLAIHRGAVAEQFVAQELLACASPDLEPSLNFWSREVPASQAEVDYLIPSKRFVLPIEVKSGASGTLKSLRIFLASHAESPVGVRLYGGETMREELPIENARGEVSGDLGGATQKTLWHLPLYAAGVLVR